MEAGDSMEVEEQDDDVCLDASFFLNEKYGQRKSGSLNFSLLCLC
jgi:hypothetical protein